MRMFRCTCEGFKDQKDGQRPIMVIDPDDIPDDQKAFRGQDCYVIPCDDFREGQDAGTIQDILDRQDEILRNQLRINQLFETLQDKKETLPLEI